MQLEPLNEKLSSFSPNLELVSVQGWLTALEQQALRELSIQTRGPILEIGPWIGRSTSCLAHGLLLRPDRQAADRVVTVELNPDESYFRQNSDNEIEFLCPGDTMMRGKTTMEIYTSIVLPAINYPGGLIAKLQETLREQHLDHLVDIVEGDFLEVLPVADYGLIFSDVSHTPYEIGIMCSGLRPVLRPGVILACHDTSSENREVLESSIKYEWTTMCDSLHIGCIGA